MNKNIELILRFLQVLALILALLILYNMTNYREGYILGLQNGLSNCQFIPMNFTVIP